MGPFVGIMGEFVAHLNVPSTQPCSRSLSACMPTHNDTQRDLIDLPRSLDFEFDGFALPPQVDSGSSHHLKQKREEEEEEEKKGKEP